MSGDESALSTLDLPTDPEAALKQAIDPDSDEAAAAEVVKLVVYCETCGEATNRFDPGERGRAFEAARAHVAVAEKTDTPAGTNISPFAASTPTVSTRRSTDEPAAR